MRLKTAFFFLVLAASAHADWTIVSSASEPGRGGVVHRRVVVESAGSGRVTIDLAIFSTKSCTLRILQNEDGTSTLAEAMERETCLAGVNGGYFDEKFAPIGLRIVNGQTIAPLQRARLITGVLAASSRGVQIVRAREFSRRPGVTAAVQCGPFLVDQTRPINGLNNSNVARRTFAATTNPGRALLGVCSSVSLAELSKILATTSFDEDLKIERALNLDGGSSTGFWFARENGGAFSISEKKAVRDFVGIVPK
jgi:exopolysaccharide biosynthesis protein